MSYLWVLVWVWSRRRDWHKSNNSMARVKDTENKLLLLNPNYLLKYPIWASMTSHSLPAAANSSLSHSSTSIAQITITLVNHEAITCPSHSCHWQCFCLFISKWWSTNIYAIEYASAHHGWKLEGEKHIMIWNRKKWNALDRLLKRNVLFYSTCVFFKSLLYLLCV